MQPKLLRQRKLQEIERALVTKTRRPTVGGCYLISSVSLLGWGGMHLLPLSPKQLLREHSHAATTPTYRFRKGLSLKEYGQHTVKATLYTAPVSCTETAAGLTRHGQEDRGSAGPRQGNSALASAGQKRLNPEYQENRFSSEFRFSWAIILMIFCATKLKSRSKKMKKREKPHTHIWVQGCESRDLISNPRCASLAVWCWAIHFILWALLSSWIEPSVQLCVTQLVHTRADQPPVSQSIALNLHISYHIRRHHCMAAKSTWLSVLVSSLNNEEALLRECFSQFPFCFSTPIL